LLSGKTQGKAKNSSQEWFKKHLAVKVARSEASRFSEIMREGNPAMDQKTWTQMKCIIRNGRGKITKIFND